MNERSANVARNILALGAMFGGMPLYAGVPRREFAGLYDGPRPMLLNDGTTLPAQPKRKLRPLAERKARRAKRKQKGKR